MVPRAILAPPVSVDAVVELLRSANDPPNSGSSLLKGAMLAPSMIPGRASTTPAAFLSASPAPISSVVGSVTCVEINRQAGTWDSVDSQSCPF
ncbi:hypothetical protein B0J17DRAFT_637732 [Rhizoctonia solani]|nr:hypothetical protein B0J17DRAFT_637732 [Rhizoctonia solani]